ncbi:MAG: hypothetical protein RPR97_07255 [Colwellia sp.]|jgi:Matrixin.
MDILESSLQLVMETNYQNTSEFTAEDKTFTFNINNGTDNFVVYITSEETVEPTYLVLIKPNGDRYKVAKEDEKLYSTMYKVKRDAFWGKNNMQVPVRLDNIEDFAGEWKVKLKVAGGGDGKLRVAARKLISTTAEPCLQNYTLTLSPVLVKLKGSSQFTADDIMKRTKGAASVYNNVLNINIEDVRTDTIDVPINGNFKSDIIKELTLRNTSAGKLTILYIEDLKISNHESAGGIAGSTPGPQGFVSSYGACLIAVDSRFKSEDRFDLIIAHEMGHYLGLTHESAFDETENIMLPKTSKLGKKLNDKQINIIQNMPFIGVML